MAVQSSFFDLDGATREFGSTKHIATKRHLAVWLRQISDGVWVQLTSTGFDLINNFAVTDEAPDDTVYDQIEIRVADTEDELTQSPSDVTIVAGISTEVQVVAGISSQVVTVAGDSVAINTVSTNIADVNTVADNIGDVNNAYEYSLNAQEYAVKPEDTLVYDWVAGSPTTNYSALHWAAKAEAYAVSLDPTTIVRKTSDTGVAYMPYGTTLERPALDPLVAGIRYNSDLTTFEGWDGTTWTGVGGGATGAGGDKVFVLNEQTVTTSYSIPVGQNAHSAGVITIDTGVTVTIPTGSQWVIS